MSATAFKYCPGCARELRLLAAAEDGAERTRLRCLACGYTYWNNPTTVLAAVIECTDRGGQLLLARNAAWTSRMFALITGFMEAGETPEAGMAREIAEETSLAVSSLKLIGVYDFQRMNQVIIAYHARASGEVRLSPELAEYKLYAPGAVKCWQQGTGRALADWLVANGHEPQWMEAPPRVQRA